MTTDENIIKKEKMVLENSLKFTELMGSVLKIHSELIKYEWQDQAKIMNFLNDYFNIELKNKRINANYHHRFLD